MTHFAIDIAGIVTDCAPLGRWLMFNKGTDHEAARATFEAKFGKEPARVWDGPTHVFAGPAPQRKEMRI